MDLDGWRARIDALNARLALLQRLRSKYKTDLAGLIALRARRREEISRVENAGVETKSLAEERDAALSESRRAATALSGKRKTAALKFDAEVNARLATRNPREHPAYAQIQAELRRHATPHHGTA